MGFIILFHFIGYSLLAVIPLFIVEKFVQRRFPLAKGWQKALRLTGVHFLVFFVYVLVRWDYYTSEEMSALDVIWYTTIFFILPLYLFYWVSTFFDGKNSVEK